MLRRPIGVTVLAAVLLTAGLAGIAAFAAALWIWLSTPGTSPLAQLLALAWSCAFVATAVMTWRRSRRAPAAFLASAGLLVLLLWLLLPGAGQLFLLPLFVITLLLALPCYLYLRGSCRRPA